MKQWIIGVGAVLFVLGCSGPDHIRVCTPGTTLACLCGTSDGSKVCEGDGSGYGVCMCDGVDSGMAGTDTGAIGTDAPIMMSDAPVTTDPVAGSWCAPVGGWTTGNVYTFGSGNFTSVGTGDIPSGESSNGGCHVVRTLRGTYTTGSGVLTLTHGAATDERTGCDDPGDNGATTGSPGAGTDMYPFSVSGGVLTLGSGTEAFMLTSC